MNVKALGTLHQTAEDQLIPKPANAWVVAVPITQPRLRLGLFYWNPLSVAVKTHQYTRDGVDRVWQGLGRAMGITESQLPCPLFSNLSQRSISAVTTGLPKPRYQQTRFQQRVAQAIAALESWASNPWRRLSLQLIVLLISFSIGGTIGTISGAFSELDPVGALICVSAIELAIRARGPLLRRQGDRLILQLLDMARLGLLYGLLLDGFKLL